jgi:hypothetical protein
MESLVYVRECFNIGYVNNHALAVVSYNPGLDYSSPVKKRLLDLYET